MTFLNQAELADPELALKLASRALKTSCKTLPDQLLLKLNEELLHNEFFVL
jgi:hypothetical protein